MKRFFVHVPGWVYAGNFYGKSAADQLAAAVAAVRNH